jgi:hypothetical protein
LDSSDESPIQNHVLLVLFLYNIYGRVDSSLGFERHCAMFHDDYLGAIGDVGLLLTMGRRKDSFHRACVRHRI